MLHCFYGALAVAEGVKRGAVKPYPHRASRRAYEAAADSALCGNADPYPEFTGIIVHPAGEHKASKDPDMIRRNEPLAAEGIDPVI